MPCGLQVLSLPTVRDPFFLSGTPIHWSPPAANQRLTDSHTYPATLVAGAILLITVPHRVDLSFPI